MSSLQLLAVRNGQLISYNNQTPDGEWSEIAEVVTYLNKSINHQPQVQLDLESLKVLAGKVGHYSKGCKAERVLKKLVARETFNALNEWNPKRGDYLDVENGKLVVRSSLFTPDILPYLNLEGFVQLGILKEDDLASKEEAANDRLSAFLTGEGLTALLEWSEMDPQQLFQLFKRLSPKHQNIEKLFNGFQFPNEMLYQIAKLSQNKLDKVIKVALEHFWDDNAIMRELSFTVLLNYIFKYELTELESLIEGFPNYLPLKMALLSSKNSKQVLLSQWKERKEFNQIRNLYQMVLDSKKYRPGLNEIDPNTLAGNLIYYLAHYHPQAINPRNIVRAISLLWNSHLKQKDWTFDPNESKMGLYITHTDAYTLFYKLIYQPEKNRYEFSYYSGEGKSDTYSLLHPQQLNPEFLKSVQSMHNNNIPFLNVQPFIHTSLRGGKVTHGPTHKVSQHGNHTYKCFSNFLADLLEKDEWHHFKVFLTKTLIDECSEFQNSYPVQLKEMLQEANVVLEKRLQKAG